MTDPLPCPSCSFANAVGADICVKCGTPLAETPDRVHPGETLRDPDDLTLPPSPLLRAVLRGDPEALASARRPARGTPAPEATPAVSASPSAPAPTPAASASPSASPPTASAPAVTTPAPPTVLAESPSHAPATPVAEPLTAITATAVERLSPTADQTALLRELAERLHAGKAQPVVHYAGFFIRVVAFLVDGAVLGAFGVPLAAAGYLGVRAGSIWLGHTAPLELDETLFTLLMAAWFTMATTYFTALHRSCGQTIGKSLVGIEVRSLHLDRVGPIRALVRTLGYAVSSTFFGFGFLLVALTPRKRGWHDFLARTCVVRTVVEEPA